MNIRKLSLAAAAIAAIAPVAVFADSERNAVNACAKAFAASVADANSGAQPFKLKYASNFSSGITDQYVREFTFVLHARDPKTGKVVATATCSADTHGVVVALSNGFADASSIRVAQK